jgi:hypothetical protein
MRWRCSIETQLPIFGNEEWSPLAGLGHIYRKQGAAS